jgi:hypothetical protein
LPELVPFCFFARAASILAFASSPVFFSSLIIDLYPFSNYY